MNHVNDKLSPEEAELLAKLPSNVDSLIILLKTILLKLFGDLSIPVATKQQLMGQLCVDVVAHAPPATGEMVLAAPKCTLYLNSMNVRGPVVMQPFGLVGLNLWKASFIGVNPGPNFAKVEVTFVNAQYQTTTKSSSKPITQA